MAKYASRKMTPSEILRSIDNLQEKINNVRKNTDACYASCEGEGSKLYYLGKSEGLDYALNQIAWLKMILKEELKWRRR